MKFGKRGSKRVKKQEKKTGRHAGLGRGLGALIDAPAAPAKVVARPALTALGKKIGKPEEKVEQPVQRVQAVAAPAEVPSERLLESVLRVPITEVVRSPWQPRQTFDEAALQELADSIKANGIIQPLVCRKLADGHFELIGGERRLRASMIAGITHVPVILVEAEDRRAAELAIVENIQRADLNAIEEAEG